MATKYTKAAQTGDEGVALVQSIVANAGAIYRSFDNADLGVDGMIELLTETGEPSGDLVLVQIKSGASYIRDGQYRLRADKGHFETWSRYPVPVVGIVCNPKQGTARWVDISKHLREHPERVETGPYSLTAPKSQPFSTARFSTFASCFQKRHDPSATSTDTTPNLLIREWKPEDAIPTQALLKAISLDYPGFDLWLSKKMNEPKASKKVVEVGRTVAAFSMWQRKDRRNVKLQTFMVGQNFRGTAVGQHLLYHELRTWAQDPEICRVYVTVSSSKKALISYFKTFGFRVEGFAPNRYDRIDGAAELILAKHFVRSTIRTIPDLKQTVNHIQTKIWGLGSSGLDRFGVASADIAIPVALPSLTVYTNTSEKTVETRLAVVDENNAKVAVWDDAMLMRDFYPLRVHLLQKRYVIIPIFKKWFDKMLSTSGVGTPLKLRIDNVYYCYPKLSDLQRGDLVLFYEPKTGGGRGVVSATAIVLAVATDTPKALHARFGVQGIYKLANVEKHAKKGKAMAIQFGLFEEFGHGVTLDRIRAILGKKTNVQGLTPVGRDHFETILSEGRGTP